MHNLIAGIFSDKTIMCGSRRCSISRITFSSLFFILFSISHLFSYSDVFSEDDYSIKYFDSPILKYNFCELVSKSYYANCTQKDLFTQMKDTFISFISWLWKGSEIPTCLSQTNKFFFNCSQVYEANLTDYEKKMLITAYLFNETGYELNRKINELNDEFYRKINSDLGPHQKPPPKNAEVYNGEIFKNTWIDIAYVNNSFVDQYNKTWIISGEKPVLIYNIDFVYQIPERREGECDTPRLVPGSPHYDYDIKTFYNGVEANSFFPTTQGQVINFSAVLTFSGEYKYKRYHWVTHQVCILDVCTDVRICEDYYVSVTDSGSVSANKTFYSYGDMLTNAYIFIDKKQPVNSSHFDVRGFAFLVAPSYYDCTLSINGNNLSVYHTTTYPGVADKDPYDFFLHMKLIGIDYTSNPMNFIPIDFISIHHDPDDNQTLEKAEQLFLRYNAPATFRTLFNRSRILNFVKFRLISDDVSNCQWSCVVPTNTKLTSSIDCNYNISRQTSIRIEKSNLSIDEVEVKIILDDYSGNRLPGKEISITYLNEKRTVITNANGEYALNLLKHEKETFLFASFETDGIHMSSESSIMIDPLPPENPIIFWLKVFIIFGLLYYCYKQILYMYRF